MFSTVFKGVTGVLDRRFLLNTFVPCLVFWGLWLAVWLMANDGLVAALKAWGEQHLELKVVHAACSLAGVWFFAMLAASQSAALLRLYEGYWDFPLGTKLAEPLRRRHLRRLAQLNADVTADPNSRSYEEIYHGYPLPTQPEEVMPTRLGNILKNSELYAKDRYKLDAVLLWPRLFGLLPKTLVQMLSDARAGLDSMLLLTTLGVLFALSTGIYLAARGASWTLLLPAVLGGLLVALFSHRGALGHAQIFGHLVKTAFDLHRSKLLKQFRLRAPGSLGEERVLWPAVCSFLYRVDLSKVDVWKYKVAAEGGDDETEDDE